MESQPDSWKLRQNLGSQPSGWLIGPRQPEADIPVQVTQAQSSRWNFLSSDDGDLATWRTWSRVPTGEKTAALFSGLSLRLSPPQSTRASRSSPSLHLQKTPASLRPSKHPTVSSGVTAPRQLVAIKSQPPFPLKTARNQKLDPQKTRNI